MQQKGKRIVVSVFIISFILFAGAGLYSYYWNVSKHVNQGNSSGNDNGTTAEKKEKPVKTPEKRRFETNDDIKLAYGRLEIVYLFNGKRYEGAVISTDEYYTIVTINGTIKIPMSDVKIRKIVK